MRPGFKAFKKKNPLTEGVDFCRLPLDLVDGGHALEVLSTPMLGAVGTVLENCLRDGLEKGIWHGYDLNLSSPRNRTVALCDAEGEMHIFLQAFRPKLDEKPELKACVGKQNTVPVEAHHPLLFDFLVKDGWDFGEKCNYAAGDVTDPKVRRAVETYYSTLRLAFAFSAYKDPIRLPLPHEQPGFQKLDGLHK